MVGIRRPLNKVHLKHFIGIFKSKFVPIKNVHSINAKIKQITQVKIHIPLEKCTYKLYESIRIVYYVWEKLDR